MKMIRVFSFLFLVVLELHTIAQQDSLRTDSTTLVGNLSAATITSTAVHDHFPLFCEYDSMLLQLFSTTDIGKILERSGRAQLGRYGAEGSAVQLRMNGAAADHAVFYWQGIPLNSFSLGTMDVSLLPSFLFESITPGVDANSFSPPGNGIGGNIFLNSKPAEKWNSFSLLNEFNSMLNYTFGTELETTGEKSGHRTRFLYRHFNNRFFYNDNYSFGSPRTEQLHNDGKQHALMHDSWLKLSDTQTVSFALWRQSRDMELPEIMGISIQSAAEQFDESTRMVARWKSGMPDTKKPNFEMSAAYFDEWQRYRDVPSADGWAILSGIKSKHVLMRPAIQFHLGFWQFSASAQPGVVMIESDNYEDHTANENYFQYSAYIIHRLNNHNFVAEIFHDVRGYTTSPSGTLRYRVRSNRLVLQFSAARKFRIPDFNERYWTPGGNPDLKPERGLDYRAETDYRLVQHNRWTTQLRTSMFCLNIRDMIQWTPTDLGYWQPGNIRQMQSRGGEAALVLQHVAIWKKSLTLRYTYTNAHGRSIENPEENFEMIYSPKHKSSADFVISNNRLTVYFNALYSGERFTDEANTVSRQLDAYLIFDAGISFSLHLGKLDFQFRTTAGNIFDTQYESVRAYALPGRVISFGIKSAINFSKHKTQ